MKLAAWLPFLLAPVIGWHVFQSARDRPAAIAPTVAAAQSAPAVPNELAGTAVIYAGNRNIRMIPIKTAVPLPLITRHVDVALLNREPIKPYANTLC